MYKATGSIMDNELRIIPHANVTDIGTGNSVQADDAGRFTIYVASPDSQLRISHAGYDYDTIEAGYFETMSYFELWPTSLDEVEITGNSKEADNTIWWLLGGFAAVVITAIATNEKQPRKITV